MQNGQGQIPGFNGYSMPQMQMMSANGMPMYAYPGILPGMMPGMMQSAAGGYQMMPQSMMGYNPYGAQMSQMSTGAYMMNGSVPAGYPMPAQRAVVVEVRPRAFGVFHPGDVCRRLLAG